MDITRSQPRPQTWLVICFLLVASFLATFIPNRYVVDEALEFRQLANGWVSIYPAILTDPKLSFTQKFESTVDADIIHGRFRPLYFFYASVPYALSPLAHGRVSESEEAPWHTLMNGDLRLFSMFLLGSIALSMFFLALLLYRFTNCFIYSLIPFGFIPIASSTAENLLQNYIDSQEIPLVLWVALWFLACFLSVSSKRTDARVFWMIVGIGALSFALLTKETAVVLTGVLFLLSVAAFFGTVGDSREIRSAQLGLWSSFFVCMLGTLLVLGVVMLNKQGYATAYAYDRDNIARTLKILWGHLSRYSVHDALYVYPPIVLTACLLYVKRREGINGIPVVWHGLLLFGLLSASYGFLLILIPWQPILIKYSYPGVFFFSFAVAYSLSLIGSYLKGYGKPLLTLIFLVTVFVPFGMLFYSTYVKATKENRYWFEASNYGAAALHELASVIAEDVRQDARREARIFVDVPGSPNKGQLVNWSKTTLRRLLNIRYGLNIIDETGKPVKQVSMPDGELSSFSYDPQRKSVFLSQRAKDLQRFTFDCYYRGLTQENEETAEGGGLQGYTYDTSVISYAGRESFHAFEPDLDGIVIHRYRPAERP